MLHGDVVAWMQQVRKAVQSVSEHNGSEYNSLLQQIRTKVCWEQSYCAWGPVKALDWWSVPCIVASCSHTTHPSSPFSLVPPPSFLEDARAGNSRCISTSQDLFNAMDFSDKVEHEFEVLEHSAVAYGKAGAREEGEVIEVVDSLHTNSREICEGLG